MDKFLRCQQAFFLGEHAAGDLPVNGGYLLQLLNLLQGQILGAVNLFHIGLRFTAQRFHQQDNIQAVANVGITPIPQANDALHFSGHASFLQDLADNGLFNGFVRLDKATRHLPVPPAPP